MKHPSEPPPLLTTVLRFLLLGPLFGVAIFIILFVPGVMRNPLGMVYIPAALVYAYPVGVLPAALAGVIFRESFRPAGAVLPKRERTSVLLHGALSGGLAALLVAGTLFVVGGTIVSIGIVILPALAGTLCGLACRRIVFTDHNESRSNATDSRASPAWPRPSQMRSIHVITGLSFIFLSILWLGHLQNVHAHLLHMHDARLFFRSAYPYMMLSALLNVVLAICVDERKTTTAQVLQSIGSALLLLTPFLLLAAYMSEGLQHDMNRAWPQVAVCFGLAGVLAQGIARFASPESGKISA